MVEAIARVRIVGRRVDEVLARQRPELVAELVADLLRRQRLDRRGRELHADDRGRLCRCPFGPLQLVEARLEQRVDRRRHMIRVATVRQHGEQLLDEQRIALRGLPNAPAGALVERRAAEQVLDQLFGLELRERLERYRLATPGRPLVEELGPSEAEHQNRRVACPVPEMLDEIEERRLGPVDVLDHERKRPFARTLFERLPYRPEDLLG